MTNFSLIGSLFSGSYLRVFTVFNLAYISLISLTGFSIQYVRKL